MVALVHSFERVPRLAAAIAAAIVAIGLVSAPPTADSAIPRLAHTTGVHTLAVDLAALTISTTRPAAVTPRANATAPTPQSVFDAAVTIALTPLWYAAFPVTLTGSIAFAFLLAFYASGIGGGQTRIDPAAVLELGLTTYLLGPLTYIQGKLSALVPKANSASATPKPTTTTSTTAASPREALRSASGLAHTLGSADRKPSVHRTARATPKASTDKKRTGTAASGRNSDTGAH
ncbi:hypothetical protein ACTXG7_24455 [Mycolicibacterium sp. Dal123E01]|uniref:hypothetical protein n=1 Tax=Mycolicibacterium sp. Dal123E01 TaxID=3457578 RepID=UPI00403E8DC7